MNKRGQSETGKVLWELMVLVLVLIVAASILILLIRAFFISGDNERQATLAGFQSLSVDVTKVVNAQGAFASNFKDPLRLYIAKDYVITGFNKGTEEPVDGCGIGANEKITRPSACGGSACLCLYPVKGADNFQSAGATAAQPIACSTFNNVDYITSFWYNDRDQLAFTATDAIKTSTEYVKNLNGQCDLSIPSGYAVDVPPKLTMRAKCTSGIERKHASLVLYGGCPAWRDLRILWGTQYVYVERATVDGKRIVLISGELDAATVQAREMAVKKTTGRDIYAAAESLFNEKKYAEAIAQYEQVIKESDEESLIENSRFKISEAYYLSNDFANAATHATRFMRDYGVRAYFLAAGLPSFTPLPTPLLTSNEGTPFVVLASDDEVKAAQARLTKLYNADKNSAVLAFLLGHVERRLKNLDKAITLLEQASNTLAPSDAVLPAVAWYELGQAYLQKLQSGYDKNIARGMLNAYADAVDGYDGSLELLDLYNNAHSQLSYRCFELKADFGATEPCSEFQTALDGVSPWVGNVAAGKACNLPVGMLRCGDLSVQNVQDILGSGRGTIGYARPELHYREGYKCENSQWVKAFACSEKEYCQNSRDRQELSVECFTPSNPPEAAI